MPVKYETSFSKTKKKCPDSFEVRLRIPGCSLGNRPFYPMTKAEKLVGPIPSPKPKPSP